MDRASLNNEVILMRKSLKSVLNQTKLNLLKNIKKLKKNEKLMKSVSRKESELEALKRLKLASINLHEAADSDSLKKILTRPSSTEIERATARILLNPIIQKNVQSWNQKFGPEIVESFLKSNDENIVKGKAKANRVKNKKKVVKNKKENAVNNEGDDVSEQNDEDQGDHNMSSNSEDIGDNSNESIEGREPPIESTIVKVQEKTANKKSPVQKKKPELKRELRKTSDPFFVDSKSGGNYMASVENADSVSEESDDEKPRKAFNRDKRPAQLKKSFKKPIAPRPRRIEETRPKPAPPTSKFARNNDNPKISNQVTSNDSDIHPSWKAKAQLRKQSMAEFKGTKIKFDD